jgi:putative nucleotidyltransferase with HDIG domain
LSAKLLALCNSAAYGLATRVGSIAHAVLYLGYSEIHRMVMSIGFGETMNPSLLGYALEDGQLWLHSLLTAYVTEHVLAVTHRVQANRSLAYTAGLVHDIGKIIISHALDGKTQAAMRHLVDRGESSMIEAEQTVLGTDHAEVGACLLKTWCLPDSIVEAVANHHKPVIKPHPQLSAVVHVANVIALKAGWSPGWASFATRADEAAVAALGLDSEHVQKLIISAHDSLTDLEGTIATS